MTHALRFRLALGAVGVAIAAYGAWRLWTTSRFDQLLNAGLWLGSGVAVHDALLAPLAIVTGWFLLRALPPWARGAAVVGAILLATLTVVAVPVLGGLGRRADNPSLLPRDYWGGWLLVAGLVAAGSLVGALVERGRRAG